jgi:hypothetical protein
MSTDSEGEKALDLDKILPMPPSIRATGSPNPSESPLSQKLREEENTHTYGHPDWYSWCCARWGTKWNTYATSSTKTCLAFSSAWSPPLGAITELAKKTQETWILEYIEEGCDFIGRAYLSPEGMDDECYNIEDAPEELKEALRYTPPEEYEEGEPEEEEPEEKHSKTASAPAHSTPDNNPNL